MFFGGGLIVMVDLKLRLLNSIEKLLLTSKNKEEAIRELEQLRKQLEKTQDIEQVIIEFEEKQRKKRAAK